MTYSHSVDRGDRPSTLREGIALLSWLGVSGETTWRVWEESDVMPVANGLVACCDRFFGGLAGHVSGSLVGGRRGQRDRRVRNSRCADGSAGPG